MLAALGKESQAVADDILLDFELYTATWEHEVKFEEIVAVGPKTIEAFVGTDDEIFGYVDQGTRPHVIRPKNAKALHFFPGYVPKTQPGMEVSGKGGYSGDSQEVFSKGVNHPGTEPRHIVEDKQKEWQPKFLKRMQEAMKIAAKASGHGK
jgi:hypothetical protein